MHVGNNGIRHVGDRPAPARSDGECGDGTDRPDPLFDALPEPAVLTERTDAGERVLRINGAFARTFDCERDAVVGDSLADLFQRPERDGESEVDGDRVRETIDGTEREFRVRRVPADDPEGRVHSIYTDVTERTADETTLTALHETTRRLMAAESTEAVLDIGVHAARDILGFDINAIYRYDDETGTLVPAVTTERTEALLGELPSFPGGTSIAWRAFETGRAVVRDDVREDPDVFNSDTPFRSELLLPLGDRGVLLAGSTEPAAFRERDRALGQMLAANVESALEQVEREETLRERERALARRNERLEEFASIVSHDLRTPLDLAGAHLELAAESDEAGAHLDDVAAAHRRMSALIGDVLTWAREGDLVESTESVAVAALVSECWDDRQPEGATLEIGTDRTVAADRSRLRQLFDNLLGNAVTYAGPDASIRVGDFEGGVYVADDGPGVPPEERGAVFDFGHTLAAEGTGFGLAIVGEIVEAHGWSIRLTESETGGARFEIRF
ncbi:hypothetical protein BRC76_06035 [Halobacteriales archaeon QH_8_67_36]|nr:MAG: hypothetical protein BRC76_06035 [Halobacteriales archaeon QH_8_67_36]